MKIIKLIKIKYLSSATVVVRLDRLSKKKTTARRCMFINGVRELFV